MEGGSSPHLSGVSDRITGRTWYSEALIWCRLRRTHKVMARDEKKNGGRSFSEEARGGSSSPARSQWARSFNSIRKRPLEIISRDNLSGSLIDEATFFSFFKSPSWTSFSKAKHMDSSVRDVKTFSINHKVPQHSKTRAQHGQSLPHFSRPPPALFTHNHLETFSFCSKSSGPTRLL